MDTKDNKKKLRAKLKAARNKISKPDVEHKSRHIAERLRGFVDWQNINKLHIYKTIAKNNEVDTQPIIDFCRNNWPKIEIHHPKEEIDTKTKFDLVLVPLLGFDRNGNRMGYGGGYYDKFLATQKDAKKIGLAFSFQEVSKIPTESHDQTLDSVVTENKAITF